MGVLVSKIVNLFSEFGNRQFQIVMIGLEAVGKTTILYRLKLKETVKTIPTCGFNIETIQLTKSVTLTILDLASQGKLRRLRPSYFKDVNGADGLVCVVDCSDIPRLPDAREELFELLDADELRGVPIVVIANKQDFPNAIKADEVARQLGLLRHMGNPWHVQEACALNGEGLYEAMHKMVQMVKQFRKGKGSSRHLR